MEGVVLLLIIITACYFLFRKKKEPEIRVTVTYGDDFKFSNSDPIEEDTWQDIGGEFKGSFQTKANLLLDYEDGRGQRTKRKIEVLRFDDYGQEGYLFAHCLLRGETRTFRTDRVRECIDIETGEVIESIPSFLRERYKASPEGLRDALLEAEYDSLRVLLYMGKADGQLRAAEKNVIYETCRALEPKLTDEVLSKMFSQLEVPSIHAFKLAIGRLSKKSQAHKTLLFETAQKIVATQKTIHPSEQEALDYMSRRLFVATS